MERCECEEGRSAYIGVKAVFSAWWSSNQKLAGPPPAHHHLRAPHSSFLYLFIYLFFGQVFLFFGVNVRSFHYCFLFRFLFIFS